MTRSTTHWGLMTRFGPIAYTTREEAERAKPKSGFPKQTIMVLRMWFGVGKDRRLEVTCE